MTEVFFLPDEVARKSWSIPAPLYNLYRGLLTRSQEAHVFVPIRSMQYMAVLDKNEIVFVDSLSYAVSGNEGGRLIMIAWEFPRSHDRASLGDAMPCDIVFYDQGKSDIQLRLVTEFRKSMEKLDHHYRDQALPANGAKILSLLKK